MMQTLELTPEKNKMHLAWTHRETGGMQKKVSELEGMSTIKLSILKRMREKRMKP